MAKRLTSEEAFQRAELIRADWESGRYESMSELAREYDLVMQYVRNILMNKKCVRTAPPGKEKKDWKRVTINGIHYGVYRDGRIWSFSINAIKQMSPDEEGYLKFYVKNPDGSRKKFAVHRLVLTAWGRKPNPGEQARHKNDDKTNNHIDNLEWGTNQDNVDDRYKNGGILIGSEVNTAKLSEKQALMIYKGFEKHHGNKASYVQECAEEFEVGTSTIYSILNGMSWNHVTKHPRKTTLEIPDSVVKGIRQNYAKYGKRDGLKKFCQGFARFLAERGYDIGWITVRKIVQGELMTQVKP